MNAEAGSHPSVFAAFAPSALHAAAVPLGDVVGLRDAGDVHGVAADVDVGPVRRDAAGDVVDRAGLHRMPRAVVHRDVVGVRDLVHVDEAPRGVEPAGGVGGQRVDRAVDLVGRVGHRRRRRPGVHVAGHELVRRRQARAVGEVAADVELAPDDLQRLDVRGDRGAERLPARAVPDGDEVRVGVAARVDEVAARRRPCR